MSRRSVAAWIACLSLVLAAWSGPVSARSPGRTRRVVLIQTPPALERALRTALMPWGMRVARSQARARSLAPQNPEQARVLARRLRADALVWLSQSSRRHELWLYDNVSGAMTARGVPAPPFDDTRAAALALSVKTELRKGTLADAPAPSNEVAEQSVAPTEPAPPTEPVPPLDTVPPTDPVPPTDEAAIGAEPAPAAPAAAPPDAPASDNRARLEVAAAKAPTAPTAPEARPAELPEPPAPASEELDTPRRLSSAPREPFEAPTLRLLLHAGVRGGATSLGAMEGRYGVEGRWAPWASPTSIATLWFGARFDLGLPQTFSNAVLRRGEYSELGGGLGVGASVHLSHSIDVGAQVGVNVSSASLSGTRVVDQLAANETGQGYSLHLRPEMELSLGTFGVLLQPALGTALARQEYVVKVENVPQKALEMSAFWWQVGVAFRVNVN
jgi:hypothetical protein